MVMYMGVGKIMWRSKNDSKAAASLNSHPRNGWQIMKWETNLDLVTRLTKRSKE